MRVLASDALVGYQKKRLLMSSAMFGAPDREAVERVNSRISVADTMFEGDVQRYFLVGLSGLQSIGKVLDRCPSLSVRSVLDFPSGGGRVGRFLAVRFPDAEITACDLDTEMVDFCADVLRMRPVYSQVDFSKIDLGRKFDLIWCGSLVTHLNSEAIVGLWHLFDRHLEPGGVVVFTTHGDYVEQLLASTTDWPYEISSEAARGIVEAYRKDGFGFTPYVGRDCVGQMGESLTSPAWVRAQCAALLPWQELLYEPRGWDNHQDVFGFRKALAAPR
jgi:SAM-dependent methyltransferase